MCIEIITHLKKTLAIVVKPNQINDSLKFVSPESFPLQVGIHNKEKGFVIKAHEHIPFKELKNVYVQEVFYIKKGKIKVGIYDKEKVTEKILEKGDLIILNSGHDIEFLEESKLIEVKQGHYRGKEEKRYL